MKAFIRKTIGVAFASSIVAASSASAQTRPVQGSLSSVKPIAASVTTCATGLIEIAPVSFDTSGQPEAWVVVQRVDGEVVSAQRITARGLEQLRRAPCGMDTWRGEMLEG